MQVLTFGVQVAEVAVDIETGEVWVDRIAAIRDVGRVIHPLGAHEPDRSRIIQGIGHTLSEQRLHDPRTGQILTTTLDAYELPTIADVPEIVGELVDEPDGHLTNLGSKGSASADLPTAARSRTRSATRPAPRCTSCRSRARRCCARYTRQAKEREADGAPAGI